jgi:crossover junction endodeoxyribonuclease RuvC
VLILGVDPGTAVTGFGVVRTGASHELVECGVIRTRADEPLADRLFGIAEGLREVIARHRPDAIAVEDVFYGRNVRTTVVLGHARGVILLVAREAGLVIHEYPPAEIKKAIVGNGNATKPQVQFMVGKLLRLKSPPQPSDAADGVAAALTCAMRAPLERALAAARR